LPHSSIRLKNDARVFQGQTYRANAATRHGAPLTQLIWRELIRLSRVYDTTRNTSEKRKIAAIFDALIMLLSVVFIAGPLILTAAEVWL
jgi:hypothetical protein